MKTPEQILIEHDVLFPVPGAKRFNAGDGKLDRMLRAMEEYAKQFIDAASEKSIHEIDMLNGMNEQLLEQISTLHGQLESSEKRCVEVGSKNAECWDKINALENTIGRLENDLTDGVKILETIWLAFDRDYLMKSLIAVDYEKLKDYLGK
jgi:hypothetical protein